MSFNGIYQFEFGTLTTKNGKVINFNDIDTDADGRISQQEYNFIQKEICMDTIEFKHEEQKGEKEVTDFEFIWWQQESNMQESFDELCSKVATEFIGSNAKYSSKVLKELREYLSDFKEEYKNSGDSIIEMSSKFNAALPNKYEEIKRELLW